MKVKADITIEVDPEDLVEAADAVGEDVIDTLIREVTEAIKKSESYRDMRRAIYHACLDKLREDVAKDFIDKIKGES